MANRDNGPVVAGRWKQAIAVWQDRRILAVGLLGFASGLPLALTFSTLSFWLKEEGLSNTAIGLFASVSTPYTLKFLWAPLVDRLELPLLGRVLPWPGNVRELKNALERAMILDVDTDLLPEHLPQEILENRHEAATGMPVSLDGFVIPDHGISMDDVEHALVKKALEIAAGNQTKAAQLLRMPRDTFRRRMKRYGII